MPVPKYDDLLEPLLKAMHDLGGSASIAEQEDRVAANVHLSDKDVAEIHRGSLTGASSRRATAFSPGNVSRWWLSLGVTLQSRQFHRAPFRGTCWGLEPVSRGHEQSAIWQSSLAQVARCHLTWSSSQVTTVVAALRPAN